MKEFETDTGPAKIDAADFGQIYAHHMAMVYGVCLKYLGSVADAQDAVMEIYEHLASRIGGYEVGNFRGWLWSVARNHCLARLRREKRMPRTDFEERVMESPALLHLLDDGDRAVDELGRCMERLPEGQRGAVRMFFFDKMSYADVAAASGDEVKTVKSHIQNGKRNLRICLERHGVHL